MIRVNVSSPPPLRTSAERSPTPIGAGTIAHDWVRIHGAIVTTLQTSQVEDALANVFSPALRQVKLARD